MKAKRSVELILIRLNMTIIYIIRNNHVLLTTSISSIRLKAKKWENFPDQNAHFCAKKQLHRRPRLAWNVRGVRTKGEAASSHGKMYRTKDLIEAACFNARKGQDKSMVYLLR